MKKNNNLFNVSVINFALIFFLSLSCLIFIINIMKLKAEIIEINEEKEQYILQTEERFEVLIDQISSLENELKKKRIDDFNEILEYIEPIKEVDKYTYMVEYNKILKEFNMTNGLYDEYTSEEINIICQCIETEVYQCPFEAKVNIANVIFNRLEDDKFPSDPISVITAKNQFAYHRTNISKDTILALEYAYLNEDTTGGAIGFKSDNGSQKFGEWDLCYYDGYHWFYK